jgi:hypothetical protein
VERIRKLDPTDLHRELAQAQEEIGKILAKGL